MNDLIIQLQERIKELTCLYSIAEISNNPELSLPEILQSIINIIPPAMQYPHICFARVLVDGDYYQCVGFKPSSMGISEEILVNYQPRGILEVVYLDEGGSISNPVFLPEERQLLKTLCQQIAMIIERKNIEETNAKLQEQLRHADRLATIGQLAAGIAHEINEPLGTILGFAQLIQSSYTLESGLAEDVQKIVNATLHGREVIKKLMLFSRQMPPKKSTIDLNKVIADGFYFLENRCAKQGVEIIRELETNLPEIVADPSQMHQVLVNLTVNAMQAMPNGGTITISTKSHGNNIELSVKDNGIGMKAELIKKIFIPFYTTKDINQGTGLGLSVVHGIVSSHNGVIKVESEYGKGSNFRIILGVHGG